jgi:Fe-S-cluster formation regulator IscX/YfhJ
MTPVPVRFTRFSQWIAEFSGIDADPRPLGGSIDADDTAEWNDREDRQRLQSRESGADDWFEVLDAISSRQTRFLRADVIPFRLALVASFLLE